MLFCSHMPPQLNESCCLFVTVVSEMKPVTVMFEKLLRKPKPKPPKPNITVTTDSENSTETEAEPETVFVDLNEGQEQPQEDAGEETETISEEQDGGETGTGGEEL